MSLTGAAADTINETGEVTLLSFPSASFQDVFIERESLPTGMLTPNSWENVLAASTPANKEASCPGCPQAPIQLADKIILSKSISALTKFVNASPIAIRLAAAALEMANGVFSPIAIASPL